MLDLRDIDFRRGADGAGRVVVNLASTQVGVDLKQQGKDLVVLGSGELIVNGGWIALRASGLLIDECLDPGQDRR